MPTETDHFRGHCARWRLVDETEGWRGAVATAHGIDNLSVGQSHEGARTAARTAESPDTAASAAPTRWPATATSAASGPNSPNTHQSAGGDFGGAGQSRVDTSLLLQTARLGQFVKTSLFVQREEEGQANKDEAEEEPSVDDAESGGIRGGEVGPCG